MRFDTQCAVCGTFPVYRRGAYTVKRLKVWKVIETEPLCNQCFVWARELLRGK